MENLGCGWLEAKIEEFVGGHASYLRICLGCICSNWPHRRILPYDCYGGRWYNALRLQLIQGAGDGDL